MQGHNIYEKYMNIVAEINKSNTTRIKAENILKPIITNIARRALFSLMNKIIKSIKI